jgi:hypothetical protein
VLTRAVQQATGCLGVKVKQHNGPAAGQVRVCARARVHVRVMVMVRVRVSVRVGVRVRVRVVVM